MLLTQRRSTGSRRLCEDSATAAQPSLSRKSFTPIMIRNLTDSETSHRLSTIMNADRIMVITGGELVEQGSHEELIQAKGKYAELWSKQIFVKPKDEDKTPATHENLVNDLNSDVAELELAKAKCTQDGVDTSDEGDSSGSEDSEDSTDTLVTPGHKKEV